MKDFNLRNFLSENKLTRTSKLLSELEVRTGPLSVYQRFRKYVSDENISPVHPMPKILDRAEELYKENDKVWDGMFENIDDALVFAAEDYMEAYRDDEDVQEVAKYIINSVQNIDKA